MSLKELPDHLRSISILVVDDMTFYHSLVQQTLENMGHMGKIHFAINYKNAISVVNDIYKSGEKIDFIISDYHLPDATGSQFAKKIRANPVLENIPFIIYSTNDNSANILEAISSGVDNYIFKPIDHQEFLEKIVFCWAKRNKNE